MAKKYKWINTCIIMTKMSFQNWKKKKEKTFLRQNLTFFFITRVLLFWKVCLTERLPLYENGTFQKNDSKYTGWDKTWWTPGENKGCVWNKLQQQGRVTFKCMPVISISHPYMCPSLCIPFFISNSGCYSTLSGNFLVVRQYFHGFPNCSTWHIT